MSFFERNMDKRLNPKLLVPEAKSVISVLLNYFPGNPDISTTPPKISRYALGTDYHTVLKKMLWQLLDILREEYGPISGRAFVDSAPVLETIWAQKAGLGWIGKHSLLINPQLGSFLFIGQLIIDAEAEPTIYEVTNRCGTCTRCMDACPTGAIVSPGVVDARKCISYLTIEKKSALTPEEQNSLNGWCFGCDICQEVCPWNKKTTPQTQYAIPKKEILELTEQQRKQLTPEQFDKLFYDTPIYRTGYDRFMKNCNQSHKS